MYIDIWWFFGGLRQEILPYMSPIHGIGLKNTQWFPRPWRTQILGLCVEILESLVQTELDENDAESE